MTKSISMLNFATFDGQILFSGIKVAKELIDEQQKLVFFKSFNNEIERIFDIEYTPIQVRVAYNASTREATYYYAPIGSQEWIEICKITIDENAKAMLLYIVEAVGMTMNISLDNVYSSPKLV